MRLSLVISSLGAGGAERVMSTLANEWARQGHEVALVTIAGSERDHFGLDSNVVRIALDLAAPSAGVVAALAATIRRVLAIRRAIAGQKPDCVISFLDRTNVLTIMATRGLSIPVLVSERIDPRRLSPGRTWSAVRRIAYSWASGVVVQTESVASWAHEQGWRTPVAVIPNPVSPAFSSPGAVKRRPVVVGLGRLAHQKGFDLLIDAFDDVTQKWPEWTLVIAGEGPLKKELAARIQRSRRPDRIQLLGVTSDPTTLLQTASIFVLSSRFEGFPNVLLESMASGCAVIATDCPSGPSDLVRDRINGRLVSVDEVSALSSAISELIADPALRDSLSAQASADAAQFAVDKIARRWEALVAGLGSLPLSGEDRDQLGARA